MKRTISLLVPLTIIFALIIPGCYTVLVHPQSEEGYRASQVSDCTRCHADYGEYPYGHYYSPYPSYWWQYPNYGGYYAHPWWWSYYDYPYADGDNGGQASSGGGRGTKFDRRGDGTPTPPPYVPSVYTPERPDVLNIPGDMTPGTTPVGDKPAGSGSDSRGKDESKGSSSDKGTRLSTPPPRPAPVDNGTVTPDNTDQTPPPPPPADKPKSDDGKKKDRHGGGRN